MQDIYHKGESLPGENAEDVVAVQAMDEQTICHLTGEVLEDPVRNKVCKHTYSRVAIEAYLNSKAKSGNRNVNCPARGCKAGISINSLERNIDAEVHVSKVRNNKRRGIDSQNHGDDDEANEDLTQSASERSSSRSSRNMKREKI